MKNQTEAQLTNQIVKYLCAQGIYARRIYTGATARTRRKQQHIGVPDIFICAHGNFFGVEVKLPGQENRLSKEQRLEAVKIESAGGRALVWTSLKNAADYFGR